MNPSFLLAKVFLTLFSICLADVTYAELIKVRFTGTVTTVVGGFHPQIRDFDFPDVGDPFNGTYTFDSEASDKTAETNQGAFTMTIPAALKMRVGHLRFLGDSVGILQFQNYFEVGDHIPSIKLNSNPALAQILNHNNFSLLITGQDLIADPNKLLLTPPALAGVNSGLRLYLDNNNNTAPGNYIEFYASLNSLAVVPEPCGYLLLSLGLLLAQSRRFQ